MYPNIILMYPNNFMYPNLILYPNILVYVTNDISHRTDGPAYWLGYQTYNDLQVI